MKKITNNLYTISNIMLLLAVLAWTGCVTGNNNNEVLSELEEQFAKTPRVLNLLVNGEKQTRDNTSNWEHFFVKPGDQVVITATLNAGNGASESTFEFLRSFSKHPDWEQPTDDNSSDGKIVNGAGSNDFSFTYTVPSQDDGDPSHEDKDGKPDPIPSADLEAHDVISLTFYSSNDLGGQGFEQILLEIE